MLRRLAFTGIGTAATAVAAVCVGMVAAKPSTVSVPATLDDIAAPVAGQMAETGHLSGAAAPTIQVWLRPDLTGAERFAAAVSTPGSPMYRDFVSPDAYTARYGPSTQEEAAVRAWLRSRGFTSVASDAQRDYVRATATAVRADAAFQAEGRSPSVPARLRPDVLGVTGSTTGPVSVPAGQQTSMQEDAAHAVKRGSCSAYWGQHMLSRLPPKLGTTTFPVAICGYTGAQYRAAYGASSTNIGSGETVALSEPGGLEPDMFQTLKDFARQNGLPAPTAERYKQLSQQPPSCHKHDESRGEEQMDVESTYAMAPGATQLVVGGDVCDTADGGYQGGFDTDLAIIDGNGQAPLASVVSNSWETGYDDQAKDIDQIETALLVKAASVGVGMYYSAGDSPCVTQPASNPYATGVGGTTLAISRSGRRLFETGSAIGIDGEDGDAWSRTVHYFGLGGGQSLLYRQPAYQKGVVPAAMSTPPRKGLPAGQVGCRDGGPPPHPGTSPMRSAPDLSASDGNMSVGLINTKGRYTHIIDGDSSLSAPLVAGMVVAAQQGQARPFGFLNPALYKLAGTSAFYDPLPITRKDPRLWRAEVCPGSDSSCGGPTALWLTDDQSRTERGYTGQVTTRGYDNTTGLGVPNGQAFARALRDLR